MSKIEKRKRKQKTESVKFRFIVCNLCEIKYALPQKHYFCYTKTTVCRANRHLEI